jgi:phosphoribosylglycinamide formyltransferase-1
VVDGALRVAVFASHSGSNLQALIEDSQDPTSGFEIAVVISKNRDCPALDRARAAQIRAVHLSRQVHPDPDRLAPSILSLVRTRDRGLVRISDRGVP